MQNLKEILKTIPKLPGVYQYFDSKKKIIYIGKSVNLHSRVNSYFNGTGRLNFAKKKMVSEIKNIEVVVTNTAKECLLLETNLIKKHKPKYNILMKDDKNHTYIKITEDIIPKVIKTRNRPPFNSPLAKGGGKGVYFGPYISTNYVNNIIKITKKVFGHRSCNIVFEETSPLAPDTLQIQNSRVNTPFFTCLLAGEGKSFSINEKTPTIRIKATNGSKVPCIDYYIKRCSGPCLLKKENIEDYHKSIENIKNFLSGDFENVIKSLTEKMQKQAKILEFEEAGKTKEMIASISSLKEEQLITGIIKEDLDIINFLEKYDKFYLSKIEIRNQKITGIYNFEIENKLNDIDDNIAYFLENHYLENEKKLKIILPKTFDFEKEFLEELNLKIETSLIGDKTEILKLAYKNAFEFAYKKHLEGLSVKGFTKKDMTELLSILGYKQINKDIIFECNDISHISGNHTVASRSVIENGKPANSKYRKFKIKTLEKGEINDFDSMREIMSRRLAEIKKTGIIPDLIIIDGGKGQLSSVVEVIEKEIKRLELKPSPLAPLPEVEGNIENPPSPIGRGRGGGQNIENENYLSLLKSLQLVSLAKKEEELFLPHKSESILISKDSNILRMIQKIRDEAHRFAITFNRDSRIKESKRNILEELPGIGPKTRQKLLKNYGSIDNIVNDENLRKILSKSQIEVLESHGII